MKSLWDVGPRGLVGVLEELGMEVRVHIHAEKWKVRMVLAKTPDE
jgi:hypothetical protein